MTQKIISRNYEYCTTYGGCLSNSDFDTTNQHTRNMARRIAADWKFDQLCKKEKEKNYNAKI